MSFFEQKIFDIEKGVYNADPEENITILLLAQSLSLSLFLGWLSGDEDRAVWKAFTSCQHVGWAETHLSSKGCLLH